VDHSNPELQLLESIYRATDEGNSSALVSQRQLARNAGLSVGLTNALIRRFIERGWVKLLHVDGRKIKYALTPEGMEEIAIRVVEYFERAERNTELYRKKIDIFMEGVVREGYEAILLVGLSELDFLFDYACLKHGIQFYKNAKLCFREIKQYAGWGGLIVICADNIHELEGFRIGLIDDIKVALSLPEIVPVIKFSQILMEGNGRSE